jgi:HEAT repeat protein
MKKQQALAFLKKHQPLPPDSRLTQNVAEHYDEILRYFLQYPDTDCIPLFLNSFGDGDGLGIYVLIEDVIQQFAIDEVVPYLIKSLSSPLKSVRYWNAQIALNFPSPELVSPLSQLLKEGDFDMRYACITALGQIKDDRIEAVLKAALAAEKEEEIRELIKEILGRCRDDLKGRGEVLPMLHQKLSKKRLQYHWVLVTLAKIASPCSIEPLIEFRNRWATEADASLVVEALKQIKTDRAYEALLQLLFTPAEWIGSLEPLIACRALAEWKAERALNVLTALAENPKVPAEVRAEAMKAVKREA